MHKIEQVCVGSRMMKNSQLNSTEVMRDITAVITRNVSKILQAIATYISRGTGPKRVHCTNTHIKCKCLPWLKLFTHFLGCAVAAATWRMCHEFRSASAQHRGACIRGKCDGEQVYKLNDNVSTRRQWLPAKMLQTVKAAKWCQKNLYLISLYTTWKCTEMVQHAHYHGLLYIS